MGLFSQDKTSTTTQSFDERLAASDQGIANRGAQNTGGTGTASSKGNISGATVADTGAIALSNSSRLNTGLEITGSGTANIQNVDKDVIGVFGQSLADILHGQQEGEIQRNASLSDLLSGQSQQTTGLLESIGNRLSTLAQSQQTGGASDNNRVVLIVVVAVLALMALIFWRRN